MMEASTKKRRWWQFGLRSMFVLVLVVAVYFGSWKWLEKQAIQDLANVVDPLLQEGVNVLAISPSSVYFRRRPETIAPTSCVSRIHPPGQIGVIVTTSGCLAGRRVCR